MTMTDIFNRALGFIGHDRTITEGETSSAEYVRCYREWDGSRLAVLSAHPWNFLLEATPITEGAETTDDVTDELAFEYDRPTDVIRIIQVTDGSHRRIEYRVAGGKIYTSHEEIIIEYMEDEEDPDNWPHFIQDAVAAELASRIALPMTANAKMVEAMKGLAMKYLSDGKLQDAREVCLPGTVNRYVTSRR